MGPIFVRHDALLPTAALPSTVIQEIAHCLKSLKDGGLSVLLVDKNLDEWAPLAARTYVMAKGRMVWDGATSELLDADHLRLQYLGV